MTENQKRFRSKRIRHNSFHANIDVIGLVDCLNGNEDLKHSDKNKKDGAFKIKRDALLKLYGSSAILYAYNLFFFYLSKYTQKFVPVVWEKTILTVLCHARKSSE